MLFLSILLFSCDVPENKQLGTIKNIAAKVGDRMLYEQDMNAILAEVKGEDSILLRKRFVNNWIREQLLLKTAKMKLTENERDVEDRVNDYKASLLINLYKQKYLLQHLNPLVTDEEVTNYLKEHPNRFVKKEPLYRYYWAKILKKNKKDFWFISHLFRKTKINLKQKFDLESTTAIEAYDTGWHRGEELLKKLPKRVNLGTLKKGLVYRFQDKNAMYLIKPIAILKGGVISPKKDVKDKIKGIILRNRKIELTKKLEYEIYEDAKEKQQFEVY